MAKAQDIGEDFVAAFNAHDEEKLRALSTDDAIIEAPGDVHLEGGDAVTAYAVAWLNAFPDAKVHVHETVASGDWVVQRFTFKGTHTDTLAGPTGEIPATNRVLEGRGLQMLRVKGDAIAETQLYFDQVQVMTQLGLMPEPASASA